MNSYSIYRSMTKRTLSTIQKAQPVTEGPVVKKPHPPRLAVDGSVVSYAGYRLDSELLAYNISQYTYNGGGLQIDITRRSLIERVINNRYRDLVLGLVKEEN